MIHFWRILFITFLFACILLKGYTQVYFSPTGNFTEAMNINLLEVKVNDVNMEVGDEIGIFDDSLCAGAAVLDKNLQDLYDAYTKSAVAGADDTETAEKDGFASGNDIAYKIWDKSEGVEIGNVEAKYYDPQTGDEITTPKFEIGATLYVALKASYNYKPRANAGNDTIMNEREEGELDGSASNDLNGDELSFAWSDLDGLGLTGLSTINPTFTAPGVTADTDYRVTLTVNDGTLDSNPDTIIVTVKNLASGPVANAGDDFEIYETETGILDGSQSYDPDSLSLSYSWVVIPTLSLTDADKATAQFQAPEVTEDMNYQAVLTLTNSEMITSSDTVFFVVKNANIKPVAVAVAEVGDDREVSEGEQVILSGLLSIDPDDAPDTLSYNWSALNGGELENQTNAEVIFYAPWLLADSVFMFSLTVFDGDKYSDPDTVSVKVVHENLKPIANAGEDVLTEEGKTVHLNGEASFDPEGQTILYEWSSDFLHLDNSNRSLLSFIAPEVQRDTIVWVSLKVSDGELRSDPDTVYISIQHVNKTPEWIILPTDSAYLGKSYSGNIEVYEADLYDTVTLSVLNLPVWLNFVDNGDGTARIFSDSIPLDESLLGQVNIALNASDGLAVIDTTVAINVSLITSIFSIETSGFKVYPNPTDGIVNLVSSHDAKQAWISIYNENGELLFMQQLNNPLNQLDLSRFPKGMYFLRMTTSSKKNWFKKIIVN